MEITSATPSSVCLGTNTDVTLRGRGFIIELGRAMCRFKAADGQFYREPTLYSSAMFLVGIQTFSYWIVLGTPTR